LSTDEGPSSISRRRLGSSGVTGVVAMRTTFLVEGMCEMSTANSQEGYRPPPGAVV
jgi:hypothetical protein